MSIQINFGDHKSPVPDMLTPVPFKHQWVTKWARARAKEIASTMESADKYFKSLPAKRSSTELLADRRIWINYAAMDVRGIRFGLSNEIGIGELAYLGGQKVVVATLIHELAHIAGALGGESRAAEDALLHCGLGEKSEARTGKDDRSTPYDPKARG